MKRPLLVVTIAYIIGIIIGVYLQTSISFIFAVFLILILFTISIKNIIFAKLLKNNKDTKLIEENNIIKPTKNSVTLKSFKNLKKVIVIVMLSTLISIVRVQYLNSKYEKIYSLDEQKIQIVGTICDQIKETDYKYAVTVKLDKTYKNTKLTVYFDKKVDTRKLEYGNQILVTGTYSAPNTSRNYKGFDNRRYLQAKGISGTVKANNDLTVIKTKNINIVSLLINKLSCKFRRNLEIIFNERVSGLALGILLGDNSKIQVDIKENFAECNLSHMLAVSGAHLAYLVLGINTVLNKKIFGIRNQKILRITLISIFMIITNMSPSVVRAGISAIIAIISTLIYRKQDTYTTICIALLITLISNPFALFNIGLQLSYLATISIVIFYPKMTNKISPKSKISKCNLNKIMLTKGKISNYVFNSIMLTISANVLILPLLIYNFNEIPLNSILSNLFAGPILAGCIILGFLVLIISIVSMPLAKIFAIPLNLLFNLLITLTSIISKMPFGNYTVVTPYLITVVLFYVIIFLYLKNKKKLIKILITFTLIIFVANQLLSFFILNNALKIYFIDVGQGDSCLICSPTGKKILIDGGGSRDSEKYDVGEKVLVPYLLDRRIKTLDYILMSHFDADHAQGLESVIKNLKVKTIIISKQASICSEYEKIIKLCKEKKVKVIVVKRGTKIEIDKYIFFEILHPGDRMLDDGKGGLNANAIVAKLYYKINKQNKMLSISTMLNENNSSIVNSKTNNKIEISENSEYFTMLFTGDIEKEAEKELVKIYGEKLKSDIIKVAHHGSKTSSTYEFIQAVNPKIALIGVGKNNTFGHPNSGVLERLENIKVKIFRTDLNGEITIEIA